MLGRWIERVRVRRRNREEASTILSPGGFAAGVILGVHADALTARQFSGERITWHQSRGQRPTRDIIAAPHMDGDHHNDRRDSDETERAAERADIWN